MKTQISGFVSLLLFATTSSIMISCGGSQEKEPVVTTTTDSVPKTDSTNTKLYSLPAPMQIATAIKSTEAKYMSTILCPVKNTFTTDFDKMIHLGGYAVDLGYANVYDQKQTSITYFSTSLKLADELRILPITEPGKINGFKNNISNKDSVTYYTLSTFNDIHQNLVNDHREGDAYVILTGSFIEGAYLSTKVYENGNDKKIMQLIGSQKLVVESLLELMSDYTDKKEIADLCTQLESLKTAYESVEIKYAELGPNMKKLEPIELSKEAMSKITTKIAEIRNLLLN